MKQRIKLSTWAKLNGYHYNSAFRLFKRGKIPNAFRNEIGSILVEVEDDIVSQVRPEHNVVYARVSSSENKANLDTQAQRLSDYAIANGWTVHEVIKECASGLNDDRPKLSKLLTAKKATRIIVEHKDRLTRFGFNYIKLLYDGEIIVVNQVEDREDDIVQDFVSIITSFCARIYGKRRSSRKTEELIRNLQND